MRLVYRFKHKYNEEIYGLCKISKNLYNQGLYLFKQELKDNNKWLFYNDLNKKLQTTTNLEGKINYRLLKAQVSQQCLKLLEKDIKSYIKSVKDFKVNVEKYKSKPRMPRYKKDANLLIYPNQSCTIKNGYINLSKTLKIKIPQYSKYKERLTKFQQVRILPNLDKSLTVEIVYNCETLKNYNLSHELYASVDLGVNNLATMVLPNNNPILYNGKEIKSRNQYFNKKISKLKSKLNDKKQTSKQIKKLYVKRENQLNDIFHKLSRKMVNKLIENGIGNLVVGYNKGWKDSINIGKRNNQTFVYIPYEKLVDYLKYKCEMCGITFTTVEESYTSKCDALAFEPVQKHERYLGKRVKRGLFKSSTNKVINADVNGALNILRKVSGESACVKQITGSGRLFRPVRENIFKCV